MLILNDLTYRLGSRLLFDHASATIQDGARVGFVARNGTGKTTLFRMITGQEKQLHHDATHLACTIEMADLNSQYDCAVIDEIQLIEDPERGYAWTNALLGLQAKEIHICGD